MGSIGAKYWSPGKVTSRRAAASDKCPLLQNQPQEENAMSVDVKYRTSATATGGRDGQAGTTDGSFNVKLATPKELGGAGGPGNNPEQLFAAGYAACFIGAMKAVAPAQRLVDAAHQVCPYSNATRGNVDVGLTLA
jgi:organic hydroperoxide reductase OsmC/OhrA